MTVKVLHAPSAQEAYFRKAINIQNNSFKADFADKKFAQSCESLCTSGWCNSCKDCAKCALKWAHDKAIEEIKDPVKQQERYDAWLIYKYGPQISKENRAVKSIDKRGHKTEVLRVK